MGSRTGSVTSGDVKGSVTKVPVLQGTWLTAGFNGKAKTDLEAGTSAKLRDGYMPGTLTAREGVGRGVGIGVFLGGEVNLTAPLGPKTKSLLLSQADQGVALAAKAAAQLDAGNTKGARQSLAQLRQLRVKVQKSKTFEANASRAEPETNFANPVKIWDRQKD